MPLQATANPTNSPTHTQTMTQKQSRRILPRLHVVDILRPSRKLPPLLSEQLNGQDSPTKSSRVTADVDQELCTRTSRGFKTLNHSPDMSTTCILVKGKNITAGKISNGTGSESSIKTSALSADDLNDTLVTQYLMKNRKCLDSFVHEHVSREQVESWLSDKVSPGGAKDQRNDSTPLSTISPEVNSSSHFTSSEENSSDTENTVGLKEHAGMSWKKLLTDAGRRRLLRDMTQDVTHASCRGQVLEQLSARVAAVTDADGFNVYVVDPDTQSVHLHSESSTEVSGCSKENGRDNGFHLSNSVAKSKQVVRINAQQKCAAATASALKGSGNTDSRQSSSYVKDGKSYHVLCGPMMDTRDQVVGVVELYRNGSRQPFTDQDEQVACSLLLLSDLLFKCHELYDDMVTQKKLNEFLLMVTKSIFQDIVSMDTVILKIMKFAQNFLVADRSSFFFLDRRNKEIFARIFDVGGAATEEFLTPESINIRLINYAKKLVNADRTATFLLDRHRNEIYSRVFDVGTESKSADEETNGQPKEIRFSTSKGVAGYVAATGETLNIIDAYQDERFNREIDRQTGYTTKTILCMPICIRKKIIGVVQMVNKLNGVFTKQDEESFEMFAVYCGLALHQAKLYEKIRRSEQKNKVALEVLSYHSQASEEEIERLKSASVPQTLPQLLDFNFSPWSIPGEEKPLYVLYMFQDMFSPARFDVDCLCRFTLTVRKNYRNVPYHNWSHAFSVAQTMFTITKLSHMQLTHLEKLSLFVACLCHDVDHRGYTNQFMITSSSPIASLYSTSTMEHHHFNHTITILQNEGHNIFRYMSSEEYKQVLSDIKHFILSTDLAVFFQNKGKLKSLIQSKSFDWNNPEHRMLGFSVAMTACDLCNSSKPWDIQMETVDVIFEEFYAQGDKEKLQGKTPVPMMDRDKADQLPSSQVGFLVGICVPCYDLLVGILPETLPMLEGTKSNLKIWKEKAEKVKKLEEMSKTRENSELKSQA